MRVLRRSLAVASLALAALFVAEGGNAASFTYQGRLDEDGAPKAGTVDLRFDAFTLDSGGAPLNATPVIRDGVPLTEGVFTVEVDFGANVFTGAPVFVQVGVREDVAGNASTLTGFTDLAPRQAVTATPYAQHAANVGSDAVGTAQIANNSITASDANTTSDSIGLQRRVFGACAVNSAVNTINADGTVVCDTDDVGAGAAAWGLTGNSGTVPATNFLGTTDAQPMELRGNSQRVARLESIPITIGHTANVLLGSPANLIDVGVRGATIGGGGVPSGNSDPNFFDEGPNRVSDHYGTVGGGFNNIAGDAAGTLTDRAFATVGGGQANIASAQASTVSGGFSNSASGGTSTVGGGELNTAPGEFSTVGGGQVNAAPGGSSTVGGGDNNTASGDFSTVGGGRDNAALEVMSTVGGGEDNCAGGTKSWAGGNRAKVRPPTGTGINPVGVGCDNVENTADANGDEGSFVWADSQAGDFVSQGPNQFLIRATNGVGIQPGGAAQELANIPEAPLHVFEGSAGVQTALPNSLAVFESDTSAFISILTPDSGTRGVLFGGPPSALEGGIVFNPDNSLDLNTSSTRLKIEPDGDVGIGTSSAAVTNRLHVTNAPLSGTSPGNHVALVENTDASGTISVLALKVGIATATTSHNFVTFFNSNNVALGRIEGNGTTGVLYSSVGADYAEWLPRIDATEGIAPGDVVGLHAGGRVSKRIDGALQVLIASTGAAVAGNSPGKSAEATHTLIAFVGQVQARVCGAVRAGDAIVAVEDGSGCGVARDPKQLAAHELARLAGTAWEGAEGDGEHRVRVAVGLGLASAQDAKLAALGTENAALHARLQALEADRAQDRADIAMLRALIAPMVATQEH